MLRMHLVFTATTYRGSRYFVDNFLLCDPRRADEETNRAIATQRTHRKLFPGIADWRKRSAGDIREFKVNALAAERRAPRRIARESRAVSSKWRGKKKIKASYL